MAKPILPDRVVLYQGCPLQARVGTDCLIVMYDTRFLALSHASLFTPPQKTKRLHPHQAVDYLVRELQQQGAKDLCAQLFGGASFFPLGEENVKVAREAIFRHRVSYSQGIVNGPYFLQVSAEPGEVAVDLFDRTHAHVMKTRRLL